MQTKEIISSIRARCTRQFIVYLATWTLQIVRETSVTPPSHHTEIDTVSFLVSSSCVHVPEICCQNVDRCTSTAADMTVAPFHAKSSSQGGGKLTISTTFRICS